MNKSSIDLRLVGLALQIPVLSRGHKHIVINRDRNRIPCSRSDTLHSSPRSLQTKSRPRSATHLRLSFILTKCRELKVESTLKCDALQTSERFLCINVYIYIIGNGFHSNITPPLDQHCCTPKRRGRSIAPDVCVRGCPR